MFYSNCLLEALKAKVKDWKNVKIIFQKPHHFLWYDSKDNKVHDFYQADSFNNWYQMLWHKGYLYAWSYNAYIKWLQNRS